MVSFGFRKTRQLDRKTRLNVSGSGVSISRKCGPFSVTSRGHVRLNLGHGFYVRLF
jgi:hypothetical protein